MEPSRLALQLYKVSNRLLRLLRHRRPQATLTRERASALLTLSDVRGCSVKNLADHELVAHSTMSRLVSALAADGLLTGLGPDASADRRENPVRVTEKGRRVIEREVAQMVEPITAELRALTVDELRSIAQALEILGDVIGRVGRAKRR